MDNLESVSYEIKSNLQDIVIVGKVCAVAVELFDASKEVGLELRLDFDQVVLAGQDLEGKDNKMKNIVI